MPEAIITIKQLDLPGSTFEFQNRVITRKEGSILTADDTRFTIPRGMVGMVKQGGSYKVFYEEGSFQGKTTRSIKTVAEAAPPLPLNPAAQAATTMVRPRTNAQDEAEINRRHRLNWIGERLDAVAAQLPLTKEGLWPVAVLFAKIFDHLDEGIVPAAAANGGQYPEDAKHAPTPEPKGQQWDPEIGDQIPF